MSEKIRIIFMHKIVNPLFAIVKIKEKCEKYKDRNKLIYLYYRILYQHYTVKYGIQIPANTKIGKNFSIGHWGGIVINPYAILGDNVHIMNGVLIGSESRGKRKGIPKIGNNVWIGTNACIVGGVKIEDDVLIAPNSFVNIDIPTHSIVIGNPAKVIHKENATKGYL